MRNLIDAQTKLIDNQISKTKPIMSNKIVVVKDIKVVPNIVLGSISA